MSDLNNMLEIYTKKVEQIPSEKTKKFIKSNWYLDKSKVDEDSIFDRLKNIRDRSSINLKINFDADKMLGEAKRIEHLFVHHRRDPSFGWKSISLHGMSYKQTENYSEYGYKKRPIDKFDWTEVATLCPYTTSFFKNVFPYSRYFRVRYMLLEPGGFIAPHNDLGGAREFAAINISLNQPEGCYMFMEGFGIVPWGANEARLLDIGINHSVVNLSDTNRYHIIVHGYAGEEHIRQYKEMF